MARIRALYACKFGGALFTGKLFERAPPAVQPKIHVAFTDAKPRGKFARRKRIDEAGDQKITGFLRQERERFMKQPDDFLLFQVAFKTRDLFLQQHGFLQQSMLLALPCFPAQEDVASNGREPGTNSRWIDQFMAVASGFDQSFLSKIVAFIAIACEISTKPNQRLVFIVERSFKSVHR